MCLWGHLRVGSAQLKVSVSRFVNLEDEIDIDVVGVQVDTPDVAIEVGRGATARDLQGLSLSRMRNIMFVVSTKKKAAG